MEHSPGYQQCEVLLDTLFSLPFSNDLGQMKASYTSFTRLQVNAIFFIGDHVAKLKLNLGKWLKSVVASVLTR